jgi:enoyl-CoA hydratase/carnithine racemase
MGRWPKSLSSRARRPATITPGCGSGLMRPKTSRCGSREPVGRSWFPSPSSSGDGRGEVTRPASAARVGVIGARAPPPPFRAILPGVSDILVTTAVPSVAVVTLNRPPRRNAVTIAMWRDLRRIFTGLGGDRAVRAIVLTGQGGHFCAGADIGEFSASRRNADEVIAYERDVDACTEALMAVPQPAIAAVSGFCLGGGCALAMACDFRVADGSARFGIPAARLGTVYGALDCRNLIALVGLANAKEILFGASQFGPAEARAMGFVDRVVDTSAEKAAVEWAARLAENAPLSIAGAKLILNALAQGEADAKRDAIGDAIETAAESRDYQEGVRAFTEKRPPLFTGA